MRSNKNENLLTQDFGSRTAQFETLPNEDEYYSGSFNERQTDKAIPGLENLSNFIKARVFKAEDPEFQRIFVQVYSHAQLMETKIKRLEAEIRSLAKQNGYMTLAQNHKEEMLTKVLEENRKLSEELSTTKCL